MKSFLEKTARALGLIKEIGVSIAGLENRIGTVEEATAPVAELRERVPAIGSEVERLKGERIESIELSTSSNNTISVGITVRLNKLYTYISDVLYLTGARSDRAGLMTSTDYQNLQQAISDIQELQALIAVLHPETIGLDAYAIELLRTWDPASTIMNAKIPDYKRLKILPALDTSNVTNINSAFNFSKVEKIISLDLPAVESLKVGTSYSAIFPSTLQEIGRLALPNCKTGLERLFWNRGNLERIDEFVLPQNNTFNLKQTFEGCAKLEHLGELDLRQCTLLQSAFKDCTALTQLSIKTSPALNNLRFAFHSCGSLEVIEGDIDCTNVTNMVQPIALCENLKRVNFINLGSVRTYEEKEAAIGLHRAPQWGADGEENYASLVNSLLVNSFDRTAAGYEPVVLYLSTAVVERLGEENVSAIRAKGFNVIALDTEHEDWFYD